MPLADPFSQLSFGAPPPAGVATAGYSARPGSPLAAASSGASLGSASIASVASFPMTSPPVSHAPSPLGFATNAFGGASGGFDSSGFGDDAFGSSPQPAATAAVDDGWRVTGDIQQWHKNLLAKDKVSQADAGISNAGGHGSSQCTAGMLRLLAAGGLACNRGMDED